jgi:FkbM family methyltransferase
MIGRLIKPWYVWRPSQIAQRVINALTTTPSGYHPVQVAWGASLLADGRKSIGHSIRTTGVYDLAVSETLARLIQPGDTVVDAGANIGYMSALAAMAAGPTGRLISFEPHPDLFPILEQNIERAGKQASIAKAELNPLALGGEPGEARLELPDAMDQNDGVATIRGTGAATSKSVMVRVTTLDEMIPAATINVMKLDVEGFEIEVLKGARRAMRDGRLRHVVFEDHVGPESDVARLLRAEGYHLFSLGWTLRRLVVEPAESGSRATAYEAPSYFASIDPNAASKLAAERGWRCLSRRFAKPRA